MGNSSPESQKIIEKEDSAHHPFPPYRKGVITQQPGAPPPYEFHVLPQDNVITDPRLMAKLNIIQNYEIRQGNAVLETALGGAWPNVYIISDLDRSVAVKDYPRGDIVPNPVFVVKEEPGTCCLCCLRICCPGRYPVLAKVFHTRDVDPVTAGTYACGCCYTGHNYQVDHAAGPVMTLERDACCNKWIGCFICSSMCQDDMYVHLGDQNMPVGSTLPDGNFMGRSVVPIDGGGLRPTVNLVTSGHSEHDPFAVVEGPTCFAGWKGLCCGDLFTISSTRGRAGDLGLIDKRPPIGCWETCLAMCSNVDKYEFHFTDAYKSLTPEQKATVLANIVHLDYLLFENDPPPVMVRKLGDKGVVIICTLFECWLKGCIMPCQICIPLHSKD